MTKLELHKRRALIVRRQAARGDGVASQVIRRGRPGRVEVDDPDERDSANGDELVDLPDSLLG